MMICRWHQPYGRKWRTKEPLEESERGEWKAGLKLNIQKIKIMASGPITSWQIDGEKIETGTDFIFLAMKNCCFPTVVLEKTLESPSDSKEIKPVNPKGSQPWRLIGRTDAEAVGAILWPPDGKTQLTGKDPDAGKDWRQEEKGMTEDEIVRWHHQLNRHEFEQTPGDSKGQRSLAGCSPWSQKESDTTEQLNWTELS